MGDTRVSKAVLGRLICYMANNKEMNSIFTRDQNMFKNQGLTETFYKTDSTREIVYRLLDNRNFKEASPAVREKMIYTDYYPQQAKQLESVYLDDRRSLCQEFHNRLCASLGICETVVSFSDFKGAVDSDMFYFYDPLGGYIYLNTNILDEKDDILQLLISITQATFQHQLQTKLMGLYKNYDNYTNKEKYVCLSALLNESALAWLLAVGAKDDRKGLEAANDYSATDIYATHNCYLTLEKLFEDYGLTSVPEIKDYLSEKEDFLSSLSCEGEEPNLDDYEDDDEDEEDYDTDAILNTTLCRDFTMLQEIRRSVINQKTNGDALRCFVHLLNETADDFYSSFNFPLDASYLNQYKDFVEYEETELDDEDDNHIIAQEKDNLSEENEN